MIWSVSGDLEATLKGHKLEVSEVCWNSESRFLVSASDDTSVRIWDLTPLNLVLKSSLVIKTLLFVAALTSKQLWLFLDLLMKALRSGIYLKVKRKR